jgi:hypothetical protein
LIILHRNEKEVIFEDTETGLKLTLTGDSTSPMETIDFLCRCLVTVALTVGLPRDFVMSYFASLIETAEMHTGEPVWTWEDIQKMINGEDLSE